MKRFFISGYDYIQDVALEPGTYTFWAYIKSDFGNTFTFALANEADEWEVFDVDVQQGQWTKAYEIFTIKEKKVRLSLIYRYFDEQHPVYVLKPQLIKGNIPSDAGSSPFDIDKVTDDLHDAIGGIEDFTNEEFADRVLSSGERVSLRRDLEAVEVIFQSLKGSYEKLLINPFVDALVLADLTTKYNAVSSAKDNLFTTLNTIINGDNIVTPEEIAAKDLALSSLNSAIYDYNTAEKEVANALGEDYTRQISAIRDFTDIEFSDRMLSSSERVSLSHDLDTIQTLLDDITASYNEIVLNPYLTVADITLLTDKYNALLDAWDAADDPMLPDGLKTVILDIINGDEVITQEEIDEKDLALANFNNKLGEYSAAEVQMSKFAIDHAIEQATFWSINATSPVIYKDAKDAITDGVHTQVTVKGQLHRGTDIQDGGFITVTPNGETEPATAVSSPITISPSDNADKSSYTVRLYDTASKTTLLDTLTIPVVFKGASGINAINVVLSNEADVLPASPEGVVSDYSGSGTTIRVFEGATELDYDGVGTANGKFNVTATSTGITVGTKSESGLMCVFGNASNMTLDNASITFTISGKTQAGESFSVTKTQSFAKARTGQNGVSVTLVDVEFAKNTSSTTPPTTGWTTTAPTLLEGEQLWTRTKTTYSSGSPTYTTPANITPKKGDVGTGIESVTEEYAISTSKTVQPTSGWSTTQPTWSQGQYIWSRVKVVYKNPSSTVYTGYAVSSEWEAINELEIGGRNFYSNNTQLVQYRAVVTNRNEGETINGFKITSVDPYTSNYVRLRRVISGNGWWTVSFDVRSDDATHVIIDIADKYDVLQGTDREISSEWRRVTCTVDVDRYSEEVYHFVDIGTFPYEANSIEVRNIKLEKGNKATDWTPAPEDVQAEIDAAQTSADDAQLAADGYMKARYVRDWIQGSTLSTNNVWREINVIRKDGTNVAQGKTPSSNGSFNAGYPAANATDNNINTYAQIDGTTPATSNYVEIDLGQIYNDIDYIQIWHDYADGRTFYGTKTEISVDGVTWTTIYDSATMGTYKETIGGKTHSQRYNRIVSEVNRSKAITDKFGTRVDGGLISTVITEYRELDSQQVTGLISGIQGTNKDLPFLVAGGTYDDALSGTAKAIIRHDGSVKFTDGEFHGTVYATDGEFHGTIYATDGEFTGTIHATSGVIDKNVVVKGSLSGVIGTFKRLKCIDDDGNELGSITFGDDGRIWFENCTLYHQAPSGPFYAADIWIRGVLGSMERTAIWISGYNNAYVYKNGLRETAEYFGLVQQTSAQGNIYYQIPLYAPTTASSGCPIDLIIISHNTSAAYELQKIPGKTVIVVNSNDNHNDIWIYCNGIRTKIAGGVAAMLVNVGGFQTPDYDSRIGRGWFVVGMWDNNWRE
jgi:hypothetical protein